MINADVIQQLKKETDILKLFASYGHAPRKHGRTYKTICPFHKETEPSLSINPDKNLWQCFGCGEAGDVFSFVQKMEKIDFIPAVKKVAEMEGKAISIQHSAVSKENPTGTIVPPPLLGEALTNYKLGSHNRGAGSAVGEPEGLAAVAQHYHQTFLNQPEGRAYLASRGITNEKIFTDYMIGYCDGSLRTAVSTQQSTVSKDNKENQLTSQPAIKPSSDLFLDNKRERFLNCVVFPLTDSTGNVVNCYGRHINVKTGGHFYLPGERKGIFRISNSEFLIKKNQKLIITESVIDALSFIQHGITNVLPIYGTNGLTQDHIDYLQETKPTQIILALDGDKAGQLASNEIENRLRKELAYSFNCKTVTFPDDMDANEFFLEHSAEVFWALIGDNSEFLISNFELKEKDLAPNPELEISNSESCAIKHVDSRNGRLNVTIRIDHNSAFLLDTFNLYSQAQRNRLEKDWSKLTGENTATVKNKIEQLIEQAEGKTVASGQWPVAGTHSLVTDHQPPATISDSDRQQAIEYLKSPDLLEKLTDDYEAIGYTGEYTNKILAYLVMTSRKLDNPLSLIIMSNSAAGKSALQKATLDLCPPHDGKHFTRLTQQSLYYLGEDCLKNKFISIEEEEGSAEASYSLKTLLSAKVLHVATTSSDPATGKMKADIYETQGPVSVMVSTTNPEIEPEFASRALVITIDESTAQTERIHQRQRSARTLEGREARLNKKQVINLHHAIQTLLDPTLEVVNNYADKLTFPSDRLKHRRGQEHYLDLIDTVAFLRQHQKPIKSGKLVARYIEVDKTDIQLANNLFIKIMGWSIDELRPPSRELLKNIVAFCNKNGSEFTRRQIREHLKWSNTHLHNHLKSLEELEYIQAVHGANGSKYTYRLIYEGDGTCQEKFITGLKEVSDL